MSLNATYTTTTPAFRLTTTPDSGVALPLTDPSIYGDRPLAVLLQATVHDMRFTTDGSTPTSSHGSELVAGENPLYYAGPLGELQFIQSASGSVLNVAYVGVGAAGLAGFQGPTGAQGANGAQGAAGAGSQGATGAQGSQGATGSAGAQGASGAGAQGATGAQGSQGANGEITNANLPAALAATGGIVLPRVLQSNVTMPDNGAAVGVGEVDLNGYSITLGTNAVLAIIT